ncbi:torsin-3A [Rhinatrema bivittatum]|uniref:torsin-3A n=1 Tax=Rhinatrema bivittatum TaxID=194408 RepID=UPI00112EB727|nr:torsin-3A [Rhinatrema bivittatum]
MLGCNTSPLLHGCCLLLVLAGIAGHTGEKQVENQMVGKWVPPGYSDVQRQLEVATDLSKKYWYYLTCRLWHENCEREDSRSPQGWSLPLVGQEYLEILANWYCSIRTCCEMGDCRISNNITGLKQDLSRKLHGQHLAHEVVLRAVQSFLQTQQPEKALTLSFHGWSGTGKNFVARLMAENLYRDGMKSECVRIFISQLHFPHSSYVDHYKLQLKKQLSETASHCKQPLFIFDEAEKLHLDLVDTLKPYVDHYDGAGEDYRRSIFLFLSNIGSSAINEVAWNFWRANRPRGEITLEDLERPLRAEMSSATGSGFAHSQLFTSGLVDFIVPFLPLEYGHVKLCARDVFTSQGLPYTQEMLDEVASMMVFVPKEERLFSAQGCKSVSQRINYFLP